MHQTPYITNGEPPAVGAIFPEIRLKNTQQKMVTTKALTKKYTLVSVVPDVNTRVCSLSTRIFNQKVAAFPKIAFFTISTNSSTEQKNWCAAENVTKMQLLSDKQGNFGKELGLFVPEKKIDSRSVWIFNHEGKIVYRELVIEQSNEPNYEAAVNFLQQHL